MESLYFLIPISILILAIAAKVFIWAVNNNQFQHLDQHGMDILEDVPVQKTGEL